MNIIDEPDELAAWLLLFLTAGGVGTGRLGDWPAVVLAVVAIVALVGARRFDGLSLGIGPMNIDVDTGDEG